MGIIGYIWGRHWFSLRVTAFAARQAAVRRMIELNRLETVLSLTR